MTLKDNLSLKSEKLLVALGRQANIKDLNLAAAGLTATEKGMLSVNQFFPTRIPHIYAVGDMIGAPAAEPPPQSSHCATPYSMNIPECLSRRSSHPPRCNLSRRRQ